MARSSRTDNDEDEDEEDEQPAKRKKKGDDDGNQAKKGNQNARGLIYILVSIPVALVLVCCCCAPIGVYFFGKQPPFAGKWEKKDAKGNVVFDLRLDGGHDGLYNDYPEGERVPTSDAIRWGGTNLRWQAIDDNTIEVTLKEKNLKFWFGSDKGTFTWAVAGDELTLTITADKKVTKLSRVK